MSSLIEISTDFKKYADIFLEENSRLNLISKNEEKFLYEKHIYDSLSIKLFWNKYGMMCNNLIDIGCGGGFPCVPIAIEYPHISVTGIDSIRKKIAAVEVIKDKLNLSNLTLISDRVENIKNIKFDIAVSRAVTDLSGLIEYASPILNDGGYLIAYKSKKAAEEIDSAKNALKKHGLQITDIIEYTLPMKELYERKLICIKKHGLKQKC